STWPTTPACRRRMARPMCCPAAPSSTCATARSPASPTTTTSRTGSPRSRAERPRSAVVGGRVPRRGEEHQVDQPPVLQAAAEGLAGGVPEPGPQQDQPVEAHRDAHGQLPLAVVGRIVVEDVGDHLPGTGIAMRPRLLVVDRAAVGAGGLVPEELGAA